MSTAGIRDERVKKYPISNERWNVHILTDHIVINLYSNNFIENIVRSCMVESKGAKLAGLGCEMNGCDF